MLNSDLVSVLNIKPSFPSFCVQISKVIFSTVSEKLGLKVLSAVQPQKGGGG
jgi:hypothetical protein